jgi:mono/diheme cytochrome c family protein/plastocyanin
MVARRIKSEWAARLLLGILIVALSVVIITARARTTSVEIHAVMPEKGGWLPGNLTAEVGVPLNLRLTSDDVMHGFAVGQQPWPAVDVRPGRMTELSLTFDEPGSYTYYCSRWCGPNHWRMRGTIAVTGMAGGVSNTQPALPPRYAELGLDIDALHTVNVQLDGPPSSAWGGGLDLDIPSGYSSPNVYLDQAPYDVWQSLRAEPELVDLTDADTWDLVASIWRSHVTPEALNLGQTLYADNCAACHGERGDGSGVFAWSTSDPFSNSTEWESESELTPPADFGDATQMLGASSTLLQGKIIRGGMGTGMPYWGTIFTDEEINALVDFLWTFQFPTVEND